jgi:hypothetical protein
MARSPSDFHFAMKTNEKSLSGARGGAIDDKRFYKLLVKCGAKDTRRRHAYKDIELKGRRA